MESVISTVEQSVRRIDERWSATQEGWRDAGAAKFGDECVEPLEREGKVAAALLVSVASILDNARRAAP